MPLLLGLALLAGVVTFIATRPRDDEGGSDVGDPFSAMVHNKDRANGAHAELRKLLEDWEREGTHEVTVAVDGGLRWGLDAEQKQKGFFDAGLSKAATLKQTPHGRGAALDVHPVGFNPNAGFDTQPGMREKFVSFGTWAESKGFTWGGRFGSFGKDGDLPHIEIKNWATRFAYPPNVA